MKTIENAVENDVFRLAALQGRIWHEIAGWRYKFYISVFINVINPPLAGAGTSKYLSIDELRRTEHLPPFISKPSGKVDLEKKAANPPSSSSRTEKASIDGIAVPAGKICRTSNSLTSFSKELISKFRVITKRDWPSIIIESDTFAFTHFKIIIGVWFVRFVSTSSTSACLVSQGNMADGSESLPKIIICECKCLAGSFVGPIDKIIVAVARTIGWFRGSFLTMLLLASITFIGDSCIEY